MLKRKFDQSIRFRFLIVMSFIFLSGTVIISLIIAHEEGHMLKDSLMNRGRSLASYMAKISSDPLIMKNSVLLDEIVMGAVREDDIAYAVIQNEQGAALTSPFASMNYRMPDIHSLLQKFPATDELQKMIDRVKLNLPVAEISTPVLMGPEMINIRTIGRITIGLSLRDLNHKLFTTVGFLLGLNILLAIVLAGVLFFISGRMVFFPLRKVVHAYSRLSKGDRTTRVSTRATGEIRTLVNSFNRMVRDLEKTTVSIDYVNNIFNSMINALVVASTDGLILKVNATACSLTGYDEETLVGRPVMTLFSQTESHRDSWMQKLADKGYARDVMEWWTSAKGDEIPVLLSASVMRNDTGHILGIVYAAIDITALKREKEEKEKLQAQLNQAQKMEVIGLLAGGIAHDLNNILFPILGFSDLLLIDFAPGTSTHGQLMQINQSAQRGRDLVKQILAFGRQSSPVKLPVRLQPVLKEVLHLIRATVPANIEITPHIDPDCGMISADATQIHQVMMNLLTNAWHAVEANSGSIQVALKEVNFEKNESPFLLPPGRYSCITVTDTGAGMDPTLIDRIFTPYFTTKAQGKGTGLGLSVALGIVKAHGGDLRVYSEAGKGTVFHVYLPVLTDAPDETATAPAPAACHTGSERILLVDDEVPIVLMEQEVLDQLGYRVTALTSSLDALEAFRADPSAFDLVISDRSMPGMTGEQFIREVMSIRPGIPVILCTGFCDDACRELAGSTGIREVLIKPVTARDLAAVIRKTLDEESAAGDG